MSSRLIDHPNGHYRFLPGIAPYSCGVVAKPGCEIVHVTLQTPLPYRTGFDTIETTLAKHGANRADLCAVELRSPKPFTFDGFAAFNAEYAAILKAWGLFVDGVNPVARTNVAPIAYLLDSPVLYAFSFAIPRDVSRETFVVAGAGELPEGILEAAAIVARGDCSDAGLVLKAEFVMDLMESRLRGLGSDWTTVNAIDIYTVHPIHKLIPQVVLTRMGDAAIQGIHWFPSQPPIEDIEFEMDLRGVLTELRI